MLTMTHLNFVSYCFIRICYRKMYFLNIMKGLYIPVLNLNTFYNSIGRPVYSLACTCYGLTSFHTVTFCRWVLYAFKSI
jgi:hypothetical protein